MPVPASALALPAGRGSVADKPSSTRELTRLDDQVRKTRLTCCASQVGELTLELGLHILLIFSRTITGHHRPRPCAARRDRSKRDFKSSRLRLPLRLPSSSPPPCCTRMFHALLRLSLCTARTLGPCTRFVKPLDCGFLRDGVVCVAGGCV
ncbi:uncharacterized protein C8Q71DRAFT_737948 [Rhodofomes roseus]|uniref:Uncharacterized protein n=1 Tax=Rhodofomes roseus TaxID=34475 RepID=A0ABQ8KSD4_9APHY|nr:uncharacterized protein C8Q71DRAFT_737948 [Rhodofomes roseus]KAH9841622.1 hypothetical protein C8Q71DRAFT_737948 [Rhodofomes roseus]